MTGTKSNAVAIDHIGWTASVAVSSVGRMESTLEIRQLRAFVTLVEQGSVTAAALALGLAQSTVSEALSSLERAVGTAVFLRRRGSRDLVLTDAGIALLPHAHSVLAAIDAAHVAVAGASMRVRSHVAIATNESLSTYVLAGPLEVIRRRWPNTTFEVSILMCSGVRDAVEAGNRAFVAAMLRGDSRALADSYTEDGQVIAPGAPVARGRVAIAAAWQKSIDSGVKDLTLDTAEVESAGDLAYEMGVVRLVARDGKVTQGRYLVVWKREGGQWRLHRDIWNGE